MRILVVEDDEKIATFVVNGLKQNGFSVDHAADGEQALALFRAVTHSRFWTSVKVTSAGTSAPFARRQASPASGRRGN